MLILSCNLDSLLFLSKNDIMFIECSDSIACSNRVKQRCVPLLQQSYKRNNPKQCNEHRRAGVLWLQQPDKHNDSEQCNEHRG